MNWQTEELAKRIKEVAPTSFEITISDSNDSATIIDWNYRKNNLFDIFNAQTMVSEFVKLYGGELIAKVDNTDLTKIYWS